MLIWPPLVHFMLNAPSEFSHAQPSVIRAADFLGGVVIIASVLAASDLGFFVLDVKTGYVMHYYLASVVKHPVTD